MISFLNCISETWLEVMLRASLHGAIAILIVFFVCAFLGSNARSGTKCWLWRLAYLKMILLLLFVSPFEIPVLPASHDRAASTLTETNPVPETPNNATEWAEDAIVSDLAVKESETVSVATQTSAVPHSESGKSLTVGGTLLALWIGGLIVFLFWIANVWRQTKRVRTNLSYVSDPELLDQCETQSKLLGIKSTPALATSTEISSPLLMGISHPTIVFPQSVLDQLSVPDTEMVIAHELSHLKRNDLWWTWIPMAAQTLFFFHPLIWLARTRWLLDREMACDELALSATDKSAACYAEALVNVSSCMRNAENQSNAQKAFGSTCMVQTSFSLKRRIVAMNNITNATPNPRHAVLLFAIVALLAVVPWQPVQRKATAVAAVPGTASKTGPSTLESKIAHENLDFEQGLHNGFPKSWGGGGQGYELTASPVSRSGKSSGQISYVGDDDKPKFGSFTTGVKAAQYRGKRLRYSGYLKSEITGDGTAGLWMRVDNEFDSIAFDNMSTRPVKGKTDWTEYSIVLDVPEEAASITFGFLLSGKGTLWGDDLSMEIVGDVGEGPDVTDMYEGGKDAARIRAIEEAKKKAIPKNLGFEEGVRNKFPKNWFGGGKGFEIEIDSNNANSGNACVRSERIDERGTFSGVSQRISAAPFLGQLIKLSGYVKTEEAKGGGAGLWMRIDGPNRNTLGFDNMDNRPILGTTKWTKYEIEMDVPADSIYITFGYLLKGGGVAWADDFEIETVEVD